jgi:signal transduction histidine kinase
MTAGRLARAGPALVRLIGNVKMGDQLEDERAKLLRQQAALAKFGELTLRSSELDHILTEACRIVGAALGTDLAKVVALQPDGHTLLVIAGVGWKPGVVGHATIELKDDTSEGVALKTGEPMISPDINLETRFEYPSFLIDNGVRAVSNVVIMGEEGKRPFGILQVDSRSPREFLVEDTAFLRTYANLIAAAVVRLRDYATLETKTKELSQANAQLQLVAQERARVEEALHQSRKMEAVGQLTGGLAHDFNNLLTSISGSLELMRMHLAQGRTADLERFMLAALESADRAAALTHRMLAFARRQTLDPKAVDLNRLVEGMEDLFRRTVGPAIAIETKLTSKPWIALCDPNQVENALLNLVINARDAMPEGGRITIETRNAALPDTTNNDGLAMPANVAPGDYGALSVSDNGCGMTPHVMASAFDPFFTTKPVGQGTGLGLSMIQGFTQQSGGQVRLRSEEGSGTTVTLYLPRHHGMLADTPGAAVASVRPSSAPKVILVVDDEPPIRAVILSLLTDLGYRMLDAKDGAAGLAILETTLQIDFLITDVGLPGMNGRQLADAARRTRPDLKILFITGYAEGVLVDKGVLEKGMQVITKPFRLDVLASRVQGMLGT